MGRNLHGSLILASRAAVAVPDVGGVDDRVHQQALRVDEDAALLAVDPLARIVADPGPPFLRS